MKVMKAVRTASVWHVKQRRKGAASEPYVNHLIEVADLVAAAGAPEDVVCAALLHDAIEDQGITAAQIADLFGAAVAAMVCEVTDDKTLPKADRKAAQIAAAPGLSPGAKLIKLADKISNVRTVGASPPANWPLERRLAYIEFSRKVVDGLRGIDAVLEETFDTEAKAAWQIIQSDGQTLSAAS
jgi:(p)ppGpp synthase/HD superfamily hydrolase